jgi:anti-sigma B factor antagonist
MHFTLQKPNTGTAVICFPKQALGGEQGVALATMVSDELQQSTERIVLDLSVVEVMNSTGLGMLVSTLASCGRAKASLVLAAVPERVQQLLQMTHLASVFTIVETVSQATEPLS